MKMKRKKIALLLVLTMVVTLVLAGCGESGGESEKTGDTGYPKMEILTAVNNPNSIDESVMKHFGELIEEKSGGNITASLFAGTLGSESEIVEQIRANTIHVYVSATSTLSNYAAEYNTFAVPYLYKNEDEFYKSWRGKIGDAVRENYEASGLYTSENQVLIRGFRQLTANKKITSPDELKGLKLRLPETPEWITVWGTLGAIPTPISSSEVFSALQTGVVDAQENPIISNHDKGLQEVQKYTMLTNHLVDILPVVWSKDWFDGLDEATQSLIAECLDEAMLWGTEECKAKEVSDRAEMESAGMEFVEVDTDVFAEKAHPAMMEISKGWADWVYDQAMADIK